MKKSKIIKLVLVSGIMAACTPKDPRQQLYDRLFIRTDTAGPYTTGQPAYAFYPLGDAIDSMGEDQNVTQYNGSYAYHPMIPMIIYHHYGYGSYMLSERSSIETHVGHVSRGGFGRSAFHVSA